MRLKLKMTLGLLQKVGNLNLWKVLKSYLMRVSSDVYRSIDIDIYYFLKKKKKINNSIVCV